MPSPIKQVELQQALLKALLLEHRKKILGKFLFKQQGFGGRCWHNLCAISSNAIIDRTDMPTGISDQLTKSEFLVDKLTKVMKLRHKIINTLNFTDTRPYFDADEMTAIANFLLAQDTSNGQQTQAVSTAKKIEPQNTVWKIKETPKNQPQATPLNTITLCCSKCHATKQLVPSHGKYGYYLKCQQCNGNTAMKQPCPHCHSKQAKVSKRKNNYSLNCPDCDQQTKYEVS